MTNRSSLTFSLSLSVYVCVYLYIHMCVKKVNVLVAQSCLTLCDPMDCTTPASSVHEMLQARILEWVANPFSMGSSQPRDWTQASCIAGRFFAIRATRDTPICRCVYVCIYMCKYMYSIVVQLLSHVWLCDSMDCSTPGSSVHVFENFEITTLELQFFEKNSLKINLV